MTVRLCYKLVKVESNGSYRSYFYTSGASIKYAIGKKAKPVAGPIFTYYHDSFNSVNDMIIGYEMAVEIGNTSIAILECEYEPYFGNVSKIMSPMLATDKDSIVEFWNTGTVAKLDAQIYDGIRQQAYIEPNSGKPFSFICFCKWVKPIRVVSLDEVKLRVKDMS